MNNQQIQNITQVSSELGGLSFAQNEEGEWGYKPSGADAVIPFNKAGYTLPSFALGYGKDNASDMYLPMQGIKKLSFHLRKGWYGAVYFTLIGDEGNKSIYTNTTPSTPEADINETLDKKYNYLRIRVNGINTNVADVKVSNFVAEG